MRSLQLLIDGYNVVAPVAAPGRGGDANWLYRERERLLNRLAEGLPRSVRSRTCVVFDAASPPRDRADRFEHQEMDVRFSAGYAEADDLLEELISQHSSPKRLIVVSSDHRIQTAAKRRGATAMDSDVWLDRLLSGRVQLASGEVSRREADESAETGPEVGGA
ncbi:MAG: NYN domain-containing protein, partial [Planctomycetota bacterium]